MGEGGRGQWKGRQGAGTMVLALPLWGHMTVVDKHQPLSLNSHEQRQARGSQLSCTLHPVQGPNTGGVQPRGHTVGRGQ